MRYVARWSIPGMMALALSGVCLLHTETGAAAPEVTIDTGVLEGQRSNGGNDGASFLGIPYAAAPVGNLRWEPPQPPRTWLGTRKAVQFAPACPQTPAGWLPFPVWSEDCLYLNVWTPKLIPQLRVNPRSDRKVLVRATSKWRRFAYAMARILASEG